MEKWKNGHVVKRKRYMGMLIFKGSYKSITLIAPQLSRIFPADHQSVITESIIPAFQFGVTPLGSYLFLMHIAFLT
jgi:hypothetical protein